MRSLLVFLFFVVALVTAGCSADSVPAGLDAAVDTTLVDAPGVETSVDVGLDTSVSEGGVDSILEASTVDGAAED